MSMIAISVAFLLQAVPASAPSASIDGIVLDKEKAQPIAGAQISVTTTGAVSIPPVTTDSAGRFVITKLGAGTYRLTARANGYAKVDFGQRQPGVPGAPIVLAAGESLQGISIRLTPGGNVTGHLRNPMGRAVPGISVQLVRRTFDASGHRAFESVGTVRSDDRGLYRFYWMTPGRYYVVAGSPTYGNDPSEGGNTNEVREKFLYTYFPGTNEIDKSIPIDIRPGDEIDSIDFALIPAREYRIRARVVDPATGQPPRNAIASLSYWSPRGGATITGGMFYSAETGMLEYIVTPGTYDIGVSSQDAANSRISFDMSSTPGARATVAVTNSDVDLGTLRLEPPRLISGRIIGDAHPFDPIARNPVRVSLVPPDVAYASTAPYARTAQATPRTDGTFETHVSYTSLRVAVSGLAPGFYVREVRLDGADAMNLQAPVTSASQLEIVLSSKAGQIDGTLRDDQSRAVAGAQVVVVPDTLRYQTERFRQTTSDQNGHFAILSIPPGVYKVYAWEALQPYTYFDPNVLQKYEQRGQSIRVVESSRETLNDLKLITADNP